MLFRSSFSEGQNLLPRFPVPNGMDENDYLAAQVDAGLNGRFEKLGKPMGPEYAERAAYELSVIKQMGFPGYFLVVADLVRYAKENGIRVGPGRGSAAGSLVCYTLGITDIDPIEHGLLFFRFINPERNDFPDIDTDIQDSRREEVKDYLVKQ